MKIPCLNLKFKDSNYRILGLDTASSPLSLKDIVTSIWKNDLTIYKKSLNKIGAIENPITKDRFLKEVTIDDKENILSSFEDDLSETFNTNIAHNLSGNTNLYTFSNVLKFNGASTYNVVSIFSKLLTSTKVLNTSDNFIKLDNSNDPEISLYLGDSRSFVKIPKSLMNNETKLYSALSYLYVDSSLKEPNSEIYKTVKETVDNFMNYDFLKKGNYNELLYKLQQELLILNTETRLKRFLFNTQNDKISNFLTNTFDKDVLLNKLSDIVQTHYDSIVKTEKDIIDINEMQKEGAILKNTLPMMNFVKDIFNDKIKFDNIEYNIIDLLEINKYLLTIDKNLISKVTYFIQNSTLSSKLDKEVYEHIKTLFNNKSLSLLSDKKLMEGMIDYISTHSSIEKESLLKHTNKFDLYKIIQNLSLIDSIYKEETREELSLNKRNFDVVNTMNDIVNTVNNKIRTTSFLKESDSKSKYLPKANIKVDSNLLSTKRRSIKFTQENNWNLSKAIKFEFTPSGKSFLKEGTLKISLSESKIPGFFEEKLPKIISENLKENSFFYISPESYKILNKEYISLFTEVLKTVKDNENIKKSLHTFYIQTFNQHTADLLDVIDGLQLNMTALVSGEDKNKIKNDIFIENIKSLGLPIKPFLSNIKYKPLEYNYNTIKKRLLNGNETSLLTFKDSYISDNYKNLKKPLTLEGVSDIKNSINVFFNSKNPVIDFIPKVNKNVILNFDKSDNIDGLLVEYNNNIYTAFLKKEGENINIILQNNLLKNTHKVLNFKSEELLKESITILGQAELLNITTFDNKNLSDLGEVFYTEFGIYHNSGIIINDDLQLKILKEAYKEKILKISTLSGISVDLLLSQYLNSPLNFYNIEIIPILAQHNYKELIEPVSIVPNNFQAHHAVKKIINILNTKNNNIRLLNSQDLIETFTEFNIEGFDPISLQNKNAFIYNGEIFINSDFIKNNPSSLFHEMSHIIISELKATESGYNKLKELINIAKNSIDIQVIDTYRNSYKGFTETDLYEEITADLLGNYFSNISLGLNNLEEAFNNTDFKTIFIKLLEGDANRLTGKTIQDLLANNLFETLNEIGTSDKFLISPENLSNKLLEQRQLINYKQSKNLDETLTEHCK